MPKIYSTVVCYCRLKDTLNVQEIQDLSQYWQEPCKQPTQEGPFGTKCSTSLTNDIGDIPAACKTYMHLFKALTQKHPKNCIESTQISCCQNEAYLLHCQPINLTHNKSSPKSTISLPTKQVPVKNYLQELFCNLS